jgi:hypothetical protein
LPLDQPAASRKPRSSGARGVPVLGNAARCRGTADRSGAAARHGCVRGSPRVVHARRLGDGRTLLGWGAAKRVPRAGRGASGGTGPRAGRVSRPVAWRWAGWPPPWGGGATSPVARARVRRSRIQRSLTRHRVAQCRLEPSRCA